MTRWKTVFSDCICGRCIKRSVVNLRLLTKNSRKRVDKKSGKKQPKPNDYEPIVEPAPDSAFVTNTPKTPSSILSTKNTDKKDVHKIGS
jgi:hypothetical protein